MKTLNINFELLFKVVFVSLITVTLGSLIIGLVTGDLDTTPLN